MVAARKATRNGHARHDGLPGNPLQARLSSLREDFDALQGDMRGLASDVGSAAGEQVQEAVNGTIKSARKAAGRVESWGNENMPRLRKMVRSQPFAACAIALATGALFGVLLLRR